MEYRNVEPRGETRTGKPRWRLWANAGTDPITGRRRRPSKMFVGTIRQAVTEQRRWQTELDTAGLTVPDERTVDDVLAAYLRLARSKRWTAAGVANKQGAVRQLTGRLGGRTRIADLDPGVLSDLYSGAVTEGFAPATVQTWARVLRAALEYQVQPRGPLPFNPAAYATIPDSPPSRPRAPTAADVRQVLAYTADTDPDFHVFLRVTAALGTRRGETLALRRRSFDRATGTVTVESAVSAGAGRFEDVGETKTRRDRIAVLGATTCRLLAGYDDRLGVLARTAGYTWDGDCYLFPRGLDGRLPVWPTTMSRKMRQAAEACGVAVTLKDLRRFVTSQLLDAGVVPSAVQSRQGHSPQVMLRHYAETPDETARRAGQVLDGLLDG